MVVVEGNQGGGLPYPCSCYGAYWTEGGTEAWPELHLPLTVWARLNPQSRHPGPAQPDPHPGSVGGGVVPWTHTRPSPGHALRENMDEMGPELPPPEGVTAWFPIEHP